MRRHILIGLLLLMAGRTPAQITDLEIRHLGDVTDLGQTTVNDIWQDELGCMWFATREGVVRYNGIHLQRFMPEQDTASIGSSVVTVVCGDRNGHVFFGDDAVHAYDLHTRQIKPVWQHSINTFVCQDSLLYIASAPYLVSYRIADGKTDTIVRMQLDHEDFVNRMDCYPGRLYISTSKGKALRLNLYTNQMDTLGSFRSCVSFIREDADGCLWVGTWEQGLHTCNQGVWQACDCPARFIRDVAFTEDAVWIGTSQGLYRSANGRCELIEGTDKHHTLTNKSVWRIYPDREGTLWVGSYFGGVDYLNPAQNAWHYLPLPLLHGYTPVINSIIPIDAQHYYLCSEGDGLLLYNAQDGTAEQFVSEKTTNIKCSYYDCKRKKLYLGSHIHGLCAFDILTKRFEYYHLPYSPFFLNQVVRSLVPYKDGLLCGSYNGTYCFSPATGKVVPLDTALNRLLPHVCDMDLDADGGLWIAGEGIARYDMVTGKTEVFTTPVTRTAERICSVGNKVYIGTSGYGVWSSDTRQWNPQPVTYIKSRFIHNMLVLPDGNMMVIGTDGIELYDTRNGNSRHHTYANGLPLKSLYNGAAEILNESTVMLVGMDGIVFFQPQALNYSSPAPHIVFDNIRVNDTYRQADSSMVLASHSLLTMDICTDCYYDRPVLRYTLSSWNGRWLELPPTASTIRMFNLPVGRNVLQVEARSAADDRLLASRRMVIWQRPPLFLSAPAWLVYILLLVTVVIIGIRRMKKHYKLKAEWNMQQQMLRNEDIIGRIFSCINENLNNDQLNVELLVDELSIGRTRLFSIVKSTTGLTPNELIMRTRLRKAAEMLQDSKSTLSIAAIGYEVGFSSPKYFAKCFKKVYELTPSEYREQKQE